MITKRMNRSKRVFTFLTFIFCTISLALLIASIVSHKWITSRPVRFRFANLSEIYDVDEDDQFKVKDKSGQSTLISHRMSPGEKRTVGHNLIDGHLETTHTNNDYDSSNANNDANRDTSRSGKFRGEINFGLFQGTKRLNYGFGDRVSQIWIKDELMKNPNLMPFGLWLFTILSVAIAILFGLVSSIFAIINTVMTPIEVITGLHGLYLWNGFGALFCLSACLSWLLQFRNKLKWNVLTNDEIGYGWSSNGRSSLSTGYFLLVGAMCVFMLNILITFMAIRHPCCRIVKSRGSNTAKNPEGVIMLY